MCSYKAMIFAVKLACAGEEHSAGRHVDAHSECLCSKQGLWEECTGVRKHVESICQQCY